MVYLYILDNIIDYISKNPWCSKKDISADLRLEFRTVKNYTNLLLKINYIVVKECTGRVNERFNLNRRRNIQPLEEK